MPSSEASGIYPQITQLELERTPSVLVALVEALGSAAKAASLRRELLAAGLSEEHAGRFHCPVGLAFGNNRPHGIALSIAAQMLSEHDRLNSVP